LFAAVNHLQWSVICSSQSHAAHLARRMQHAHRMRISLTESASGWIGLVHKILLQAVAPQWWQLLICHN